MLAETSSKGITQIQVKMSNGEVHERGELRITDTQNIIEFTEESRLIGIYGYENPDVKAIGFFTFTCGNPIVDPNAV
jgi:hypothetical protein